MATADVDLVPATYHEAIRMLASWHGQGAEADLEIFSFPDPLQQVVRLVEVSDVHPATGSAQEMPMGKSAEYPYGSAVVFLTHEDWRQAQAGKLRFPEGWNLSAKVNVWPHE